MLVDVLDGLDSAPFFFSLLLFVRGWRQVLLTRLPVPLPRVARKHGNEMGMTPLLGMSGEDSGHRSDGKPTR